ncbi:hypothetical protein [Roseicyclus marinus]|uniref:hypothetical protein n=1 Tax=Roseicyclus marinus TaxID=2161673 RepID=UPI00240FC883|nr:hypothetical protein [Roseicyclus marinus]MDG3040578.1 hypothetical protein [Roseicyclus marinus]
MFARFRTGGSALVHGMILVAALSACTGGAPPNDVAQGVGFADLQALEARRAMLRGQPATVASPLAPVSAALPPAPPRAAPVAAPAPVIVQTAATPAPTAEPQGIAAATMAALRDRPAVPAAPPAPAPAPASAVVAPAPAPAAPTLVASALSGNPGISDEQDFTAVATRETIESDAERLARMQADRVVVAPSAVPDRPEGLGPNIVDYALATTHGLGERRYTRRPISETRHQRACLSFRSADLAQEWFLQNGGPGRDRQGLDPDGDGFACGWDPSVFRAAAAAARN